MPRRSGLAHEEYYGDRAIVGRWNDRKAWRFRLLNVSFRKSLYTTARPVGRRGRDKSTSLHTQERERNATFFYQRCGNALP